MLLICQFSLNGRRDAITLTESYLFKSTSFFSDEELGGSDLSFVFSPSHTDCSDNVQSKALQMKGRKYSSCPRGVSDG